MHRRVRKSRGTAIVLSLIVSVVITAMVFTLALLAGQLAQSTAAMRKMDQAFFAAEAGAQRVGWYCKQGMMGSIPSPLTGTCNGYDYSVSWSASGAQVTLTSVGYSGVVSYMLSEIMTP